MDFFDIELITYVENHPYRNIVSRCILKELYSAEHGPTSISTIKNIISTLLRRLKLKDISRHPTENWESQILKLKTERLNLDAYTAERPITSRTHEQQEESYNKQTDMYITSLLYHNLPDLTERQIIVLKWLYLRDRLAYQHTIENIYTA